MMVGSNLQRRLLTAGVVVPSLLFFSNRYPFGIKVSGLMITGAALAEYYVLVSAALERHLSISFHYLLMLWCWFITMTIVHLVFVSPALVHTLLPPYSSVITFINTSINSNSVIFNNDTMVEKTIATGLLSVVPLLIAAAVSNSKNDINNFNNNGNRLINFFFSFAMMMIAVLVGTITVAVPITFYYSIADDLHPALAVLTLSVSFLGDAGGFAFGGKYGRTKCFGWISPGKSLEGVLANYFASIGSAVLLRWGEVSSLPVLNLLVGLVPCAPLSLADAVLFGFLISTAGQLGDLAESVLKRAANAKDSGVFFPGHGGALDRLDALIPNAPMIYYLTKAGVFAV